MKLYSFIFFVLLIVDGFSVKWNLLPGARIAEDKDHFVVTTIFEKPYLMMVSSSDGAPLEGNDRYEGFCKDLTELIIAQLGATYSLKLVKDNRYGAPNNDSELGWNGMIGEILRKEADLVIAPLTITSGRQVVVDFSTPFMSTALGVLGKKVGYITAEKQRSYLSAIFAPFSFAVWLSLFIIYGIISGAVYVLSRYTSLEDFTINESFWLPMQLMTLQRPDFAPRSKAVKALLTIWWIFIVVVFANYIISLHKILTTTPSISLASDASMSHSFIQYGVLKDSSSYEFLRQSRTSKIASVWESVSRNPDSLTNTIQEGIHRVRKSDGSYAFVMNADLINYINGQEPCDTVKIGSNFNEESFGIAMPFNWSHRGRLNLAIIKLRENGEIARLKQKWWSARTVCQERQRDKGQSFQLSLTTLSGVYFLLFVGLIVTGLVSGIEFVIANKEETRISEEPNSMHKRQGDDAIPLT